jgi:hypothetical protein
MKKTDVKADRLQELSNSIVNVYREKNSDYGDSFSVSFKKYGPISAVVRISDKFNRIESLLALRQERQVKSESIYDTLMDMATYALMTILELEDFDRSLGEMPLDQALKDQSK